MGRAAAWGRDSGIEEGREDSEIEERSFASLRMTVFLQVKEPDWGGEIGWKRDVLEERSRELN